MHYPIFHAYETPKLLLQTGDYTGDSIRLEAGLLATAVSLGAISDSGATMLDNTHCIPK